MYNLRYFENSKPAVFEDLQEDNSSSPEYGSTAELLEIFRDNARYSTSDKNAFLAYKALRDRLNDIEVTEINVAWSNSIYDGPSQLDILCKRLKQKYNISVS
jgi:hypothetical protein